MSTATAQRYGHVSYLWDDAHAAGLDPVERLVYRSNLLGSDQRITNTGGGNTSSKVREDDPLSGRPLEVLWVKGSGGDLRTSTRANFASLELERVLGLRSIYESAEERGVKSAVEDRMVGLYPHCTYDLNPRASSIDTPLHAFIPARHVDHMHPNAVIAIAAASRGPELTREIFGDEIAWLPWQRPGFDLGLRLGDLCAERPDVRGAILGQHGLINWDDDDRARYALTLDLIERAARAVAACDRGDETFGGPRCEALDETRREDVLAAVLPWLRGRVSSTGRMIATSVSDAAMLRFVNSADAPRLAGLGTSCPDHFLRTKIKPLYVAWDPQREDVRELEANLDEGLAAYRRDYAAYYERCRRPGSPSMRGAEPTVVLIPGVGMVAWGKSKSESRVTAEFYNCAIEVMRGAEALDAYVALPEQEAFDIEYWSLEEAKLRRMPPEKALARRVVVVAGAGAGIGRTAAGRLADEGAHVVCADLDRAAAEAAANEITDRHGVGIGVAGAGLAACGPAFGLDVDVTDRDSVRSLARRTVLAYGGIDHLVITAGVYVPPDGSGRLDDDGWRRTFEVNVIGAHTLVDEMRDVWSRQGLDGSVVVTTSVNAVIAKRGSLAYDASKAAANHLVRELAVELAPHVRVNAVAPATVVEGSTMFPRDRVIASLRKYGLDAGETETTETLRARLAEFYAGRTLLGSPITPRDQSEAILFLLSERAAKTTGQVLAVDGGLPEAFAR